MEFNLDHEIRLNEDPQFKNLYSWSLQEFSIDGTKIGAEQIPWNWGLNFSATEIRYNKTLKIEKPSNLDEESTNYKSPVQTESITASLYPGVCLDGKSIERSTRYSMFGTKRLVHDFALSIHKLEEGQTLERCNIWSCVSYTYDVDFYDETTPDTVQISIWVSSEKFYSLCKALAQREIDIFQVRLKGVSGFYSDWSPSISTSDIKILTADDEHQVLAPEGCKILPPRVGEVEDFELSIVQRRALNIKQDFTPTDVDKLFNEETTEFNAFPENETNKVSDSNSLLLPQLLANEKTISRLSTPLWVIVIILIIALILK